MAGELPIDPGDTAPLYVGRYTVPTTVLSDLEEAPFTLILDGEEYSYIKSVPLKGHGGVLPFLLDEYTGEGRSVLLGERLKRYYIYATPATRAAAAAS